MPLNLFKNNAYKTLSLSDVIGDIYSKREDTLTLQVMYTERGKGS